MTYRNAYGTGSQVLDFDDWHEMVSCGSDNHYQGLAIIDLYLLTKNVTNC